MPYYVVTVACERDDVIVGVYDNQKDAIQRQVHVLQKLYCDAEWVRKYEGDQDTDQIVSEPACVNITRVDSDHCITVESRVNIDDAPLFSEVC